MTVAPLLCALLVASHAPAGGVAGSYARTRVTGHEQAPEAASGPARPSSPRTRWASYCTYGEAASDRTKQYNGRVYDAGTGFHDYGARLYWPEIGRFISADSYLGNPANPASLNRYCYVNNNPYKYTDPTGHCPMCIGAAIGGAAGGIGAGILSYRAGVRGWALVGDILWGASAGAIAGSGVGAAVEAGAAALSGAAAAGTVASEKAVESYFASGAGTRTVQVTAGGGAAVENITAAEVNRIGNAADRTGARISLVGSRAAGTARPDSDWDYVVEGSSKAKNSVVSSLPGAGNQAERIARDVDLHDPPVKTNLPHITFTPEAKK